MVRSASSRVSNHEASDAAILRDAAKWPLLRMRASKRRDVSHRLFRPPAKIVDHAYVAARLAGQADVAAVQDQPVMGMQHEFGRDHLLQGEFDLERIVA